MTGQLSNIFLFKGDVYNIAGIEGKGLFVPEDYEIETIPGGTNCWRGFQALYQIKNNKLVLDQLQINVKEDPKQINNQKAKKNKSSSFMYNYNKLDLVMNFTGSVRIAKDFIRELYVHMGHQKTSSYKTVFELHFKKGKLKKEKDISKEMAELRELYSIQPTKPEKRIKDSFSLGFED